MVRLGVNVARVFGCVPWGGEWEFYARPWERPDFDAQFNAFYALLAKAGIRLEYVPLTYSNLAMSVQRAYVQRIYDLIGNGGLDLCMVEIGNEPHVNGIDTRAAIAGVNRRGVLSSSGDYFVPSATAENGDGFWPADPKPFHHLDYGTVHTERSLDDGKNRYPRNGKEPFEFMGSTRKPWVDDEPFGIGEVEKRGGGARTTNIRAVVSHHAICHLLTPGSTIHSQAGLEGRAPDPASEPMQNRLAEAISRVWRFIPAESQSGQYSRPHLSPDVFPIQWTPDDSDSMVGHAYASLMGNRAFVVVPMPRAGWTLQPVGGWRVVRTLDGFPFVAELAR
jgi:hypothetical protein